MNKYVSATLWFTFGAATGFLIGYTIAIRKAQAVADEQVNDTKTALKAYYEKKIESLSEAEKEPQKDVEGEQMTIDMGVDPGIDDATKNVYVEDSRARFQEPAAPVQPRNDNVIKRPKNLPPTAIDTPDGYPDPNDKKAPSYLIREEDFGEIDDWDTLSLIFWKCGTVTTNDSVCEIVSPTLLLRLLPENWPDMFGWGEDDKYADCLYFRNNAERKDIEIEKDLRTYKEWLEEVYPGRAAELPDE